VPTVPHATSLYPLVEVDRWNPEIAGRRAKNPDRARVYDDSLSPVIAAGQALLIHMEHSIDERLQVRPAPGHTPGQVLLDLREGRGGIFCGDAIHHPVQVYEPAWNNRADEQPDVARATRRRLLEHCADSGALLFPTHFAAPHVVAIERRSDKRAEGFVPKFVQPGE
jgi:glyoxylase-like metal-dependent hydrolase (beta-lactamase superfamily II)